MQRFLESHIPGIQPPPSAAEWSRQAAALRKRFLKEIVYRGVPKEWYVGKARVQWLLDDGRWTMDGSRRSTINHQLSTTGYRIRKLRYEAVPGLWIPALLY